MDNILFVPSIRELEWVQDIMPGASPATLPVAGRRAIDYAFEQARRYDVLFTEVLDWHFSRELADDFAEITRTGYPVFYVKGEGAAPRGLRDIEGYPSPLTQNVSDGLVVVWGIALTTHPPQSIALEPMSGEEIADTPAGLYKREGGRWMRIVPHGLVARNVRAWHMLNSIVLRHPADWTLPGYSGEKGVHLGRSVVMEHGVEAKPPVLLADNTWCARNVVLDGDVIVGKGSFIGEGARLKRTVVGRDTYIGTGLELVDKIVIGRRVIDAATGAWIDMEDPGVARGMPFASGWARGLWRALRGRSYGRRG